jgi:hypothetical protein
MVCAYCGFGLPSLLEESRVCGVFEGDFFGQGTNSAPPEVVEVLWGPALLHASFSRSIEMECATNHARKRLAQVEYIPVPHGR